MPIDLKLILVVFVLTILVFKVIDHHFKLKAEEIKMQTYERLAIEERRRLEIFIKALQHQQDIQNLKGSD